MTTRTTPAPDLATALDERLCLALYTASRAMTSRYRPLLAELGLTYPQYLVMVLLWEDGAASVRQIGQRLRLESSTLSPLLKRLAAMGLVTRARDQQDERSVLVSLTGAGRRLQGRAAAIPDQICDASGLTPAQMATMVADLRRLAITLEESTLHTAGTAIDD